MRRFHVCGLFQNKISKLFLFLPYPELGDGAAVWNDISRKSGMLEKGRQPCSREFKTDNAPILESDQDFFQVVQYRAWGGQQRDSLVAEPKT